MILRYRLVVAGILLCPWFANASLETWINREISIAQTKLLANISRADTAPGSVVAATSHANPDYYYHWVRDAALTMDVVQSLYVEAQTPSLRQHYKHLLLDYVAFSRRNQTTATQTGLGEPKFNTDGSAYNLPWGRPQSDGPALRAITLTHLAQTLLAEGEESWVKTHLYDSRWPSLSVIKTDLEYVAHHWREASFDIWEESEGDHFYTRLVQHRALMEGADLAEQMRDLGAADFYRQQARQIATSVLSFYYQDSLILPTIHPIGGVGYKTSGLDAAVILAVLHGSGRYPLLSFSDIKVQNTMTELMARFQTLYPINQRPGLGVAIGRYPEDQYDGAGSQGGNPWVLTTLAFAELCFRAALEQGAGPRAQHFRDQGDAFLARVEYHQPADGSMAEQINRDSGFHVSASDLTWSYAAFLTAVRARAQVNTMLAIGLKKQHR